MSLTDEGHRLLDWAKHLYSSVEQFPPIWTPENPVDPRIAAIMDCLTEFQPDMSAGPGSRKVPSQGDKVLDWEDFSSRTRHMRRYLEAHEHDLEANKHDFPEFSRFQKYVQELSNPGYRYRCLQTARDRGLKYETDKKSMWRHFANLMKSAIPYCEWCWSPESLEVHHRSYEHYGAEPCYCDDVMVLCRSCHMGATILIRVVDGWPMRRKSGGVIRCAELERIMQPLQMNPLQINQKGGVA